MATRSNSANAIAAAFAASPLGAAPERVRAALLENAVRIALPAGAMLYHERDEPGCALVVEGLARVFLTSPDGRQITVRYARNGDLLGVAAVAGGPSPTNVQMLADTTLAVLNAAALAHHARTAPEVGWLLAQEVARRLNETLHALAGTTFGSLRQRVARHLLDLAAIDPAGHGLVAHLTQQELADAVGSVRPVVARILRDLRGAGLIATAAGGIAVLRPDTLLAEAWASDG